MQSSLQFTKVLEEELIAKGNCNLKGIRLFWNMVDRRAVSYTHLDVYKRQPK